MKKSTKIFSKRGNPFESLSGSMRLINFKSIAILIVGLVTLSCLLAITKTNGLFFCFGAIFFSTIVYNIFAKPKFGIYLLIVLGFLVTGLSRYVMAPWGLTIDIVLILIYISLFFKGFGEKIHWSKSKSILTTLAALWMLYIILQLANPEVLSREAWFYAMRGVGMYQFLIIPLIFILFNKQTDLNTLFILWGILSILGSLKGIYQFEFGVDPYEQKWLDDGGGTTHILFGKLRIFSFYSDAGQFGASQGHAGVVFTILALFYRANLKLSSFYLIVALLGFFGMVISGTRGALAVPAIGGIMFLILKKNFKILLIGLILGLGTYVFFAHTFIGQSNDQIRRMRTAFNPNDASLQIRLYNQNRLKSYLASRPFGGGLGATGNWGLRFAPYSFLANTATDSWYVMVWADTGIVGLIFYLFMILFVLFTGMRNILFKLKNKNLRVQIIALTCGMAGIMVASYGNGVFGQMPTGVLMYLTMVFIFLSPEIEKKNEISEKA